MSIVHRRVEGDSDTWQWDDIEAQGYGDGGSVVGGKSKHVLIGARDGAPNFAMRYFTIPPGESSNLEQHEHEHGVMVLQGRAHVMLGEVYEEIGPGDVVYIPGMERHQFINLDDEEPFAFLCVIPRKKVNPD